MEQVTPLKLTASDREFLSMVQRKYKETKEKNWGSRCPIMYLSIKQCIRLEQLAGRSEGYLSGWRTIREEFKQAYPAEAGAIRLCLSNVAALVRKGKEDGKKGQMGKPKGD